MNRFTLCNCPAGFNADPERHAPDCPGRSGAGKPSPMSHERFQELMGNRPAEPEVQRYIFDGGLKSEPLPPKYAEFQRYVLADVYDRDTRSLRYALAQWQTNSRENKLIAEENSARADKAESELAQLKARLGEPAATQVNVPAGAERCDTCDTVTARLDGDGCAKWCCFCGARLTGNYVTTLEGKP